MAGIALEGANIPAAVVGIGIGMKGGALLVPEDRVDAALKVLKDLEERRRGSPDRSGTAGPGHLRLFH
jgi:hypothetical protein